jgi:hypothetical protein
MTLTMPRPLASIEAVKLYAAKLGLPEIEAEKFYDYYCSNGWRVGRSAMKCWESAMRNWRRNWQERSRPAQSIQIGTYQEPDWARERRLKAELETLRAKLFRVGDVSPLHSHEQAAQIRAARQPITERIKAVKAELGMI